MSDRWNCWARTYSNQFRLKFFFCFWLFINSWPNYWFNSTEIKNSTVCFIHWNCERVYNEFQIYYIIKINKYVSKVWINVEIASTVLNPNTVSDEEISETSKQTNGKSLFFASVIIDDTTFIETWFWWNSRAYIVFVSMNQCMKWRWWDGRCAQMTFCMGTADEKQKKIGVCVWLNTVWIVHSTVTNHISLV